MRKVLLVLAVFVVTGTFIVPSVATLAGDHLGERENIVLAPADGPNGNYSRINEQTGELEIILSAANPHLAGEGVPDDAITSIPRIFTITYTGDENATVYITDSAADVHFFHGTDPTNSIEGAENGVTLAPNETVDVGLLVDTRGNHDVEQVNSFTVNAKLPETSTPTATPQSGSSVGGGSGGVGVSSNSGDADQSEPETPTVTSTPTPTPTPTPTATPTVTPTSTPTPAPTPTPATTPTATPTPTVTDDGTATPDRNLRGGLSLGQVALAGAAIILAVLAALGVRYALGRR